MSWMLYVCKQIWWLGILVWELKRLIDPDDPDNNKEVEEDRWTRGPRATTRSPEWYRHCRYADDMQIFSSTVKYWNLWQGNGFNSFWDILLARLKCWNFQNAISKKTVQIFFTYPVLLSLFVCFLYVFFFFFFFFFFCLFFVCLFLFVFF